MGEATAGSAAAFAGLAAAALAGVRARFRSPRMLVNRHVFGSEDFSDKTILEQLVDERYQTKLEEHNWDRLHELGPCFVTLAEGMLRGRTLEDILQTDARLGEDVRELLLRNIPALKGAMREIAESYLARGLSKNGKTSRDKNASKQAPRVKLRGASTGKLYAPVKFIARGSAGTVYTAVRVSESQGTDRVANALLKAMQKTEDPEASAGKDSVRGLRARLKGAISMQLKRQLALKQIEPTQRASAINEYNIASILAAEDVDQTCVTYLDRLDETPERLWLLLRLVPDSPYGRDLAEFIDHQFFENGQPVYQDIGQLTVLQLLHGIDYISGQGVVMRDVKPDNVLIDYDVDLAEKMHMVARWSDFGLSIDIGRMLDGAGLRTPLKVADLDAETDASVQLDHMVEKGKDPIQEALVAFWYDTQKLVPKPKWVARRPPEKCFQDPTRVHLSSYDLYMMGIIIVSMALGIDVPHIDKEAIKLSFEAKLGLELPADYLTSFELGQSLRENAEKYLPHFQHSFGDEFGTALLRETQRMLALDPRERPRPSEVRQRLVMQSPAFQSANALEGASRTPSPATPPA